MALFGLTGLGQAVGSAASGALSGQNKGEAEGYRRQAAADTLDARRQALFYQRRATDPDKDKRALYGHIAEGLHKVRTDPEMQRFFNDPENAPLTESYDRALGQSLGLATGSIPLDQADPTLLTFHPSLPGPSVPGPVGPQTPGFAAPPAPTYETPKQKAKQDQLDISRGGLGVRQETLSLNRPTLEARGRIFQSAAEVAPELNRQKVVGGVARIEGQRATTKQTQALTPVKVEQGTAAAAKAREEAAAVKPRLALEGQRVGETGRHNRVVENIQQQNADTAKLREGNMNEYRKAMRDKIQYALDHTAELEIGKNDRATLNYAGRILSAQQSIGPIRGSAAGGQADNALRMAEEVFARFGAQKAGTPAKPSRPVTTTPNKASGAKIEGPAVTAGEVAHIKKARALSGSPAAFESWIAAQPAAGQKRVRAIVAAKGIR